jgi:hypothetical protein
VGGRLVPWIPRPKLIPKRDGMRGAAGDAHLHIEVSPEHAAAPAACWRRCGVMAVSTFIVTCVPSCCSLQELLLAMSRCEVLGRVSPGRAGWRSLAVVVGFCCRRISGRGGVAKIIYTHIYTETCSQLVYDETGQLTKAQATPWAPQAFTFSRPPPLGA